MITTRAIPTLLRPARVLNTEVITTVRGFHSIRHQAKPLPKSPVPRRRLLATMTATTATASAIHLTPSTPGSTHHPDSSTITSSSSSKASSLLQLNHDNNHIFFNPEGFHNHIAHHLLAIFALGATPEQLQQAYDENVGYQRPLGKVDQGLIEAWVDEEDVGGVDGDQDVTQVKGKVQGKWKECLGKGKYFHDFEEYFQRRIEEKGWREVVREGLFAGTERSEDLLIRMFGGEFRFWLLMGWPSAC